MNFSGRKILCWLQYTVKWCHFVFHYSKLIIQMLVNEGYNKGMFAIVIRYEGYNEGYVCYRHTL